MSGKGGKRYVILTLGGAAVLMLGVFLLDADTASALLVPVFVHELGHISAIKLFGFELRGFRMEPGGLCIDYCGEGTYLAHALSALAGPACGIIYWRLMSPGAVTGAQWREQTAGMSLLLSAFNLLPVLPLDGGRILLNVSSAVFGAETGHRLTQTVSGFISIIMLALGTRFMLNGRGIAAELAAIWLIISEEDEVGIVISDEIL